MGSEAPVPNGGGWASPDRTSRMWSPDASTTLCVNISGDRGVARRTVDDEGRGDQRRRVNAKAPAPDAGVRATTPPASITNMITTLAEAPVPAAPAF